MDEPVIFCLTVIMACLACRTAAHYHSVHLSMFVYVYMF